jgi:drug/metabolite transporter (DMT)-like permease
MKEKSMLKPGVTAALLAAALFGVSAPLAKKLLGEIPPLFLAGLLYLGSGIGLSLLYMAYCLAPQKNGSSINREAKLKGKDYLWLAGAILCGGIAGPILLTVGLSGTSGSAASLLLNTEGILTAFVAAIIFREAVGKRIWIAALMMLLGSLALSYKPDDMVIAFSPGALMVAGACLMWAFDNNLTRNLSEKDPFAIARSKGLVAGITTFVIACVAGEKFPHITPVIGSLFVGMFGYGVSLVLFVNALRHLGSARTGAYFGIGPFVGALVSVILLKDPITWMLLVAASFMALGARILLKEDHSHEHAHEHICHEHRHTHDDGHHAHEHNGGIAEDKDHSHLHEHEPIVHEHAHTPELHHRHSH